MGNSTDAQSQQVATWGDCYTVEYKRTTGSTIKRLLCIVYGVVARQTSVYMSTGHCPGI